MAGGTALMLMMKAGVFHPVKLISLRKIERRYSGIDFDGNELHIGAMTTLGTLERSSEIQKHAPVITRTLRTLSNVRVRAAYPEVLEAAKLAARKRRTVGGKSLG